MKIKFSIVTPTYNRLDTGFLEKCIESLRCQVLGNFEYEHIFVNDGSTDGTEAFLKNELKKDNRIKYLYKNNGGTASAVKYGVDKATGDYITVMSDDDMLTSNSLKLRADYINKNKSVDWFYSQYIYINEEGIEVPVLYPKPHFEDFLYERNLIANTIPGGTPVIKSTIYKSVVWPEWLKRSEDYFTTLEILRPTNKYRIGYMDAVTYCYRWHPKMHTKKYTTEESYKEKEALDNKIRALHPRDLAFLASEAYSARKEASGYKWRLEEFVKNIVPSLEKENYSMRAELAGYKNSRLIGFVIKFSPKLKYLLLYLRHSPYKLKSRLTAMLPSRVRRTLSYLLRLKWLMRPLIEKNIKFSDKDPLVSIITPYYNNGSTIEETVNSVLFQTFQNFEYIIVNDGSSKVQSQILLNFAGEKIRVIEHTTNLGSGSPAAARNTGINAARGKYIVCLDADDILDPTYLEKTLWALETDPAIVVATTNMRMFGVDNSTYNFGYYNPRKLLRQNLVSTAAMFERDAWSRVGGYTEAIGYEDWEFWLKLAEKGFWGKNIQENLLSYRTASSSRYTEDQKTHSTNLGRIKDLHPQYIKHVRKIYRARYFRPKMVEVHSSPINLENPNFYMATATESKNILISVPWMTFGGAETLIYNYCREIKNKFNISFVTGLESNHEWEYKFKEITPNIYHLANLFDKKELYLEFISNYITTRNIEILHVIHNGFMFDMLPELKERHPELKVIVTMFNDRVEYFEQSLGFKEFVDVFSTDNNKVGDHYTKELGQDAVVRVIPNGIDCYDDFNPELFDRESKRKSLGLAEDDIAVFFVGRLSEEKRPNVFVEAAADVIRNNKSDNVKFFVIGDGPMKPEIEKRISAINNTHITYLGYQSEVASYLSAADIFVLSSIIEGFPLSILEAMAMKVVVIASKVGAVTEVISSGEDGFVVTPADKNEIVGMINKLNKDRKLLERVKLNARKDVETKYSNLILGENYTKLYNEELK